MKALRGEAIHGVKEGNGIAPAARYPGPAQDDGEKEDQNGGQEEENGASQGSTEGLGPEMSANSESQGAAPEAEMDATEPQDEQQDEYPEGQDQSDT